MVEKTLESPLDCKEIQPVHPKGNQFWIFIGRTDAEAETSILLPPWWEELTHLKSPWCWERLKARGEGDDRRLNGWMASSTQWTWVWVNSGSWWWTERLGMLHSMGSQRVGHEWATELNWNECVEYADKIYTSGKGLSIPLLVCWELSRSVMSNSLCPHGLYSPWNSPGKNTGVGCHALLQGIFPTQGSNPSLPHCRCILYHLNHQRSIWKTKQTPSQTITSCRKNQKMGRKEKLQYGSILNSLHSQNNK